MALNLQVLIYIRVQAEFGGDKNASGLEVICPMPQEVQRVSCSYEQEPKPAGSQTWDWQEKARKLVWKFKRFQGGSHHVLKARPCSQRVKLYVSDESLAMASKQLCYVARLTLYLSFLYSTSGSSYLACCDRGKQTIYFAAK